MTPELTSNNVSLDPPPTAGLSAAKKSLPIALAAILLLAVWVYRQPVLETLSFIGDREALQAYLSVFGSAGLLLIAFILALQVIIAAIPGHAIMLATGYIYGFWPSFIVVQVTTVAASQLAYWLAKRYGRPVVYRLASASVVDTWTERAERQGMAFFFFSFIVPIFPSDVMNFVAGLSGLSPKKFLVANFFGRLVTSISFSLIGAMGFQLSPALLVAGLFLTIFVLFAWRLATPMMERKK